VIRIVALADAGALLVRAPAAATDAAVAAILADVRARGDAAVADYARRFDRREPPFELTAAARSAAAGAVTSDVRAALVLAADRIRAFHADERATIHDVATTRDGVRLELRTRPLARVGVYAPGGTARYPSSVLMAAIPANVAGVGEIVMVTPGATAEVLLAAELAGVDRVFELGGAHAIAALAYGTATVPRVDKIVGPGNAWVAAAKRQVFGAVAIDAIAGPSEVLVIADDTAEPAWVAADLIAQAEHDRDARAVAVTTSARIAAAIAEQVAAQLADLPRRDIASAALAAHGAVVVCADVDAAVQFANAFAPEHLELHVDAARAVAARCTTAGAIFVGKHAAEAHGDYVAGPSHVLPTDGTARFASPLGVHDFVKRTSVIEYTAEAAARDAGAIATLARSEGLDGHARAALLRGAPRGAK
jgi:histidinol dehydrogenase